MRKLLLIGMLGLSSFLFGQTVCIGTQQQCIEAQKRLCASEPAPANLELPQDKVVSGTVLDESGAKFGDIYPVLLQLRVPKTEAILSSVEVKDGAFDLGAVKAGSYRLIVVKQGKQSIERPPGFDQPGSMACSGATTTCNLAVILKVHATDNPIDFCQPK